MSTNWAVIIVFFKGYSRKKNSLFLHLAAKRRGFLRILEVFLQVIFRVFLCLGLPPTYEISLEIDQNQRGNARKTL